MYVSVTLKISGAWPAFGVIPDPFSAGVGTVQPNKTRAVMVFLVNLREPF